MLPDLVRRLIPRDVLLLARLLAASGALLWVVLGGPALMPLVSAAVAFLLITSALIWRDDVRRGKTPPLSDIPIYVIVGDLAASGVWIAASAPNERSFAFVVVLAIGALAMFRLGTLGVVLTGATYVAGRVAQEYIRVSLGIPTPSHWAGAHHPERDRRSLPIGAGARCAGAASGAQPRADRERAW